MALKLIKEKGVIRPRDLVEYNIPREYLSRLQDQGIITRSGRGLYEMNDIEISENHTLAQVQKRVPHGVICLLSALQFHEMTTQMPHAIWMAIETGARKPKIDDQQMQFIRLSGKSFSEGINAYNVENVEVSVYSVAKTITDMFKFRNKIGLDAAIEALRECLGRKKCPVEELWYFADVNRVSNIIKPYIEALV